MSAPRGIALPRRWDDYLRGDDAPTGGDAFPFLRRRGPLALIGVSSAVPTPPLMATGWLGRAQLEALERLLAQLAGRARFSRAADASSAALGFAHQAADRFRPNCCALLKRHGVELVLHGHDHVHSTMWIDGPNGAIPAIGVPSASALAHGRYPAAAYNLFSIERDGDALALRADRARHRRRCVAVKEMQRTRLT